MNFTDEQIERYSRHIILQDVGGIGQEKLLNSKVLIVGLGGLGSPAAYYLAAAGIGTIGLLDSDKVDLSNLQRQIVHFTGDVGKDKVLSAKEKLEKLNPDIKLNVYNERFKADNALDIIKDYDFILDGSDNFATKFLLNDACVIAKKPFSHAGILRFDGQTITVVPGETPCYRCIFPDMPPRGIIPTCQEAGIIGAVAGIIGNIQALEAVKYIIGKGDLLTGRLLIFDTLRMVPRIVNIKKNSKCKICGDSPEITELKEENYREEVCEI